MIDWSSAQNSILKTRHFLERLRIEVAKVEMSFQYRGFGSIQLSWYVLVRTLLATNCA